MARLPFPRRHVRWLDEISAHIDGELRGSVRERFEAHLVGCTLCRARVDQLREVRLLVSGLPEVAAPRSFRLTPAMVAATAKVAPVRAPRPRFALRTAQFAAGFAMVALLAVVTIDVTTSNNSAGRSVATSADSSSGSALRATAAADSSSSKSVPLQDSSATSGVAVPQGAGVSGALNSAATPPSQQPQPNGYQYSTGGTAGGAPPQTAEGLAQGANQTPGAFSSRDEGNDGWHRPAELALGAFALAALATAATLTHRNRRNRNA